MGGEGGSRRWKAGGEGEEIFWAFSGRPRLPPGGCDEEGERHTSPFLTSLPPPFLLQVNPDTGIILSHIDVWDALEHNR